MSQDQVFIGALPDGTAVYASLTMLYQEGIDEVLADLVESHWHRSGMLPPRYKRVRISPLNDSTRIVADESRKDYIERIAQRMRKATKGQRTGPPLQAGNPLY